jgi:pimeloyl-ACP methyl ester carboxylesterase
MMPITTSLKESRTSRDFLGLMVPARAASLGCLVLLCVTAGCSQTMPDRAARMTRGYVYYLDGAGGGGLLSNWSGGVKQGMIDAGYSGAGEVFRWNTGLGVVADQDSSVEYKRSKAAALAHEIQEYTKEHPGAPVTLMGLSAGTAVAVFALEALPVSCPVDSVVLLGASISSTHDLTQALARVRNRMYVFTSEKDAVLAFLVPGAGTADRQVGVPSAGLNGFQMPPGASAETRSRYAKISYIGWRPEFEKTGNYGGHTDTVKAPFVQEYIAPLVIQGGARKAAAAAAPAGGRIRNPDYDRWAGFAPGSWATFQGWQVINGKRQAVRMTAKLVSRHEDKVVIERTYVSLDAGQKEPSRVQTFLAPATISPADHPLTCSGTKVVTFPSERLTVDGKALDCEVRTVEARGQFPEWGSNVSARIYANRSVPGGVVKVLLRSHKAAEPFEFDGQVIAFGAAMGAAPGQ